MTGSAPDVSVIVPCYKATKYIPEALDSLRAQTFRNFQTIVVNDGCPDTANLERVLEPYRDEIVYIKQENTGPSGARNAGIKAARSPWIACLDADDAWELNYLEAQLEILSARPEIDVLCPNAVYFGAGAGPWSGKQLLEMLPDKGDPAFASILSGQCPVLSGVTARREALLRAGLYDTRFRWSEDLDLWLRLARGGAKFAYHRRPLIRYRLREGSLSDDRIALGESTLRVYSKLLDARDITEEERRQIQDAIRMQEALVDFLRGRKALYAGDYGEALRRLIGSERILKSHRVRAAILMLRVCPRLLYKLVHYRYPTEHQFLH